jgi:hypothetical protein
MTKRKDGFESEMLIAKHPDEIRSEGIYKEYVRKRTGFRSFYNFDVKSDPIQTIGTIRNALSFIIF